MRGRRMKLNSWLPDNIVQSPSLLFVGRSLACIHLLLYGADFLRAFHVS